MSRLKRFIITLLFWIFRSEKLEFLQNLEVSLSTCIFNIFVILFSWGWWFFFFVNLFYREGLTLSHWVSENQISILRCLFWGLVNLNRIRQDWCRVCWDVSFRDFVTWFFVAGHLSGLEYTSLALCSFVFSVVSSHFRDPDLMGNTVKGRMGCQACKLQLPVCLWPCCTLQYWIKHFVWRRW